MVKALLTPIVLAFLGLAFLISAANASDVEPTTTVEAPQPVDQDSSSSAAEE